MRLLAILAGLAAAAAKPTRTKRKPGLLIVGLGGNNGATVLAGLHANNMKITWEGAKKQREKIVRGTKGRPAPRKS